MWRHKNIFWPGHLEHNGNVNDILLFDNCTSHDINVNCISYRLFVIFLPPNVTIWHQQSDMGMIALSNIGHKYLYLRKLLGIFDTLGTFNWEGTQQKLQRRGLRGIQYVGKTHMFYCMFVLKLVWYVNYGGHIMKEGIYHFWENVILPHTGNTDIENGVVSADLRGRIKKIQPSIILLAYG